jgi:hypothetical protein
LFVNKPTRNDVTVRRVRAVILSGKGTQNGPYCGDGLSSEIHLKFANIVDKTNCIVMYKKIFGWNIEPL